LKASDGSFYFGGINGITHFFPTKMDSQTNLIRPILTDYSIFSEKDSVKKFTQLGGLPESIYLSPNDNIIEFHLSSTDYFEPQKVVYAYKMSGIDNDWVYLGSNNQIRYMNLAAGDYKLYVKVASSSGVWSNDIIGIPVHKELEFYQKLWFWILIVIFVGLLVWSGFQIRLRQIHKENEIRLNIAANIHDDLGGTLYAINSSARKLKAKLTDVEELSEVSQLVHFCEEAYQNMGELIWAINPGNQYIYSLLERLEDYKDSILQSYSKIIIFKIGDFQEQKKISLDTKQHILMIFKESLVQ
jgi:signal transduction histidine kinase